MCPGALGATVALHSLPLPSALQVRAMLLLLGVVWGLALWLEPGLRAEFESWPHHRLATHAWMSPLAGLGLTASDL